MANNSTDQAYEDELCAFVAIRHDTTGHVVDLPEVEAVVGSGDGATIRIEAAGVASRHAVLHWDGESVTLRAASPASAVYLNGKRIEGMVVLKPGDEVGLGSAQLVVGITMPVTGSGRRALTHHEFRERLYEELARAGRGGRPTSLAMVQAKSGEGGRITAAALGSFRAGDVVGAFASDELELLLPDTSVETAKAVLERVLSAAAAPQAFVGLAVAPEHADNPERLHRAAREALAAARQTGTRIHMPPPHEPTTAKPETQDVTTRELVDRLLTLAKQTEPLLLTGEPSSGKALFARQVHDASPHGSGPFVVVSCATLDDADLARAFGTGKDTPLAEARGGTLLLEEVGDLSRKAQRHLFEALQGLSEARLMATTHRALAGLVERGAFDADLHALLAGEVVEVPPLRNRSEDILPMARAFAAQYTGGRAPSMSAGALARLRAYPWPGNVVELRNAMERAVRLAGDGEVLADHLPADVLPIAPGEGRLREHVDSVERDAIVKALADANHNQTHAAKRLGISRRALIYKMEKYSLKPPPGAARRG